MTDERLILAIGRLERALSRLEAQTVAADGIVDDSAIEQLRERCAAIEARHAKLRESASAAIEQIDRLIETQAR